MTLTAAPGGGGDDNAAARLRASDNGAAPSDVSPRVSVMETVEEVSLQSLASALRVRAPRLFPLADSNACVACAAVARAPCPRWFGGGDWRPAQPGGRVRGAGRRGGAVRRRRARRLLRGAWAWGSCFLCRPRDRSPAAQAAERAPAAQVFDGHGGRAAALYAREHLLQSIVSHPGFPADVPAAMVRARAPMRARSRARRGQRGHARTPACASGAQQPARRAAAVPRQCLGGGFGSRPAASRDPGADAPPLTRHRPPRAARGAARDGRGATVGRRRIRVRHHRRRCAAAGPPRLRGQPGRQPRRAVPPRALHRAVFGPQARQRV